MATTETVTVVGAGTMGRGIAQVFAQSGMRVATSASAEGAGINHAGSDTLNLWRF